MQLRFWASPSGRIWFSGTQKEKKKTHKLAIQSSPSFFNLWLRRLLEIGSNALTPACHCALTGVSSSISGGWSWRRHPELGRTLALFLCFLSHSPLNTPPPRLHCVLHHFIYFSSGLSFILIFSSWNDQLLSRLNDPFSHQRDQKKIKVGFGAILRNKPWFYPQIFAVRFRSLVDKSLK